jgi:hypothetical protein
MIHDIDILTPVAIEKIYAQIIHSMSQEQMREMRTERYWEERDLMKSDITRKKVTIEFYTRYKDGLRKK